MKVPEITLEDWKDYARRHDMKDTVPDEEAFAAALHRVHLREQEIEDQREANREKHLSQGTRQEEKKEVQLQAGEQPDPGAIKKESPD